jgi:rhomboid protease GluP
MSPWHLLLSPFLYYKNLRKAVTRNLVPLSPHWQWKLDRWRQQFREIFLPAKQPPRPRMCPSCGKLVGVTATKCHECGASLSYSLAAVSRTLSGLLPYESPVTYSILTLNILFYAFSLMLSLRLDPGFNILGNVAGEALERVGASGPLSYIVATGEYWRWLTACFLHGGLWHFGFNNFALLDIGRIAEERYGSARYLFVYVVSGIFGFIVSSWWGNFSVGASSPLCGLIGLMVGATYRSGGAWARLERTMLLRWVIYIFIFGFFVRVDHAAHIGGLVSGFLLGRYVLEDCPPSTAQEHKRAYLLGWMAGLVALASFLLMFLNFARHSQ